jgi:hypothetical protein
MGSDISLLFPILVDAQEPKGLFEPGHTFCV